MSERETLEARLSGAERLRQCERTASRVIDGKAVVITIDHNQLHVLNAVGTRVWELADGRPLSDIVDDVVREFAVDRERAALDVCTFAEQLLAVGAAEIAGHRA
jgi:Coenzyme PQQ synthesis protein D (PqqD)